MDPRPYQPSDHPACLAIDPTLNVPENFYVLEHEGQILACGGYQLDTPTTATLLHCTVHPTWRRQGLGRYLILYLLKQLTTLGPITLVHAAPPPQASAFIEHQGFRQSTPTTYTKKLTVCP